MGPHQPAARGADDAGHLQFQHTQLGAYLVGVFALLYTVGERGQVRAARRACGARRAAHPFARRASDRHQTPPLAAAGARRPALNPAAANPCAALHLKSAIAWRMLIFTHSYHWTGGHT